MSNEEMKLRIIEEILETKDENRLNAICEVIVNYDYDYIENLFNVQEDFKEFIEKHKPKKCCVGEE